VRLGAQDDLAAALLDAAGGEAPTVVIDFLWGAPVVAALEAAAPGARAVNVGQSAGAEATLRSGTVRGKQLSVLGYSSFALPHGELQRAYAELLAEVAAGRVTIDVETFPFDRVADAHRLAEGGHVTGKVVLTVV
jgi:NADPH:quinone reductase-like Zn-dependent oxidoreductase